MLSLELLKHFLLVVGCNRIDKWVWFYHLGGSNLVVLLLLLGLLLDHLLLSEEFHVLGIHSLVDVALGELLGVHVWLNTKGVIHTLIKLGWG